MCCGACVYHVLPAGYKKTKSFRYMPDEGSALRRRTVPRQALRALGGSEILAGLRGLCQDIGEEHGTIEMAAKLTSTIIQAAIDGFEAQKKNIDAQIAELRAMLTGAPESAAEDAPAKGTRRKFSAASRRRMREAQQLRWAKIKGASSAPKAAVKAGKPKRGITAAGRKALSIAMKKRWAAKKAVA